MQLNEEDVDVGEIIEKSIRLISERSDNAGLKLTVETDPHLPFLYADERLVKTVNLRPALSELLDQSQEVRKRRGRRSR